VKNLPKLQLIYGNMRALCEAPQMMLKYANVPYTYEMVWDYYGKPWVDIKKEIIFNRIPILIINKNDYIWQSNTIVRYLAKLTNTVPKDPFFSAYADSIFESTHEMFMPLNPTVNIFTGEKFNKNKEKLLNTILPKTFDNFEKILKKFKGSFFLSDTPYYCDFNAFHHFSLVDFLDKGILNNYPLIINFINSFKKLNGIEEYLFNRPKLIDIGVDPKFIVNGKKYPTGVNPNKNQII